MKHLNESPNQIRGVEYHALLKQLLEACSEIAE